MKAFKMTVSFEGWVDGKKKKIDREIGYYESFTTAINEMYKFDPKNFFREDLEAFYLKIERLMVLQDIGLTKHFAYNKEEGYDANHTTTCRDREVWLTLKEIEIK